MTYTDAKAEALSLLVAAHAKNRYADTDLLEYIRLNLMPRRIGKYLSKNRQVTNEDLRQEFMIGVALHIHTAKLDVGDPIEYLMAHGLWKIKQHMKRKIRGGTMQVCRCGYKCRLNKVGYNQYQCPKCGEYEVSTYEVEYHDDIALDSVADPSVKDPDDGLISSEMLTEFEHTLVPETNMHKVYMMFRDEIRGDRGIPNYIAYMADHMGGVSQQCVMQVVKRLRIRFLNFIQEYEEGCEWCGRD